jgi:hypothetical protein
MIFISIYKLINNIPGLQGAFNNWHDFIWGPSGPLPEDVSGDNIKILGLTMKPSEFKALIKTGFLILFSGLVLTMMGMIVYGVFLWITAADREDQLQKAKKVIKSGISGLLLTIGALIIISIIAWIIGVPLLDFSFLDELFKNR